MRECKRYYGWKSTGSGYAFGVLLDYAGVAYLDYWMYRAYSTIAMNFGFLEGPTWADDMIRKGLFPPTSSPDKE